MKLSIVSTLYNSEATLESFIQKCRSAAKAFGGTYEIVLVNDGSPDGSLDLAKSLAAGQDDIVIINLSRNFGHHPAMMTGLQEAKGEFVFLLDSDLEEDPDWLLLFEETRAATGADMVYGVQKARKGGWLERTAGYAFYAVYKRLNKLEMPKNVVTARLMTRRYVDAVNGYDERVVFLLGILTHAGFHQEAVKVEKLSRGASSYSLRRRLSLALDAITSFSSAPMRFVFYLGLAIFAAAIFVALYAVLVWLFIAQAPGGWTSLIISVWMLGGLTLSSIGLVGLYLGRVFDEVKARPRAIISDVFRAGDRN